MFDSWHSQILITPAGNHVKIFVCFSFSITIVYIILLFSINFKTEYMGTFLEKQCIKVSSDEKVSFKHPCYERNLNLYFDHFP
jgi:hypothetical protein